MARQPEDLIHHPLIRVLLLPPWFIYQLAVTLRNATFDCGLRRPRRLPVPVIGVGNITVGGTGKSPLVQLIADLLIKRGRRPAVISRGYRAGADGRNDEAEDSAVPVFCHPKRFEAGRAAIGQGADCLIGDDLFQHRQVARNCDIVCIDATRPWGEAKRAHGRVLPLGLLREPATSLHRASLIVITRSDQVDAARLAVLHRQLVGFDKPIINARHAPRHLRRHDDSTLPLAHLADHDVLLVSGIGNPQAFAKTCRDCELRVVDHLIFPDHHRYDRHDAERIARQLGSQTLVMTSKDAVKLRAVLPPAIAERCYVLDIGMTCDDADLACLERCLDEALQATGSAT